MWKCWVYVPGRGTVRVQSGSPGTQTLFSFMPDIICESCDGEMEMESGGEVGTLVSWHTVAPGSPGTRLMTVNTCQHTRTPARPHTYTVPVRSPANNNNDFIFCQMSRRLSYCSTEKRWKYQCIVTWRLIRWRGVVRGADTGRVIHNHASSLRGLPAQTFYFIQFKHACIACAMICRCRSNLLTLHTGHDNLSFNTDDHSCMLLEGLHQRHQQYTV